MAAITGQKVKIEIGGTEYSAEITNARFVAADAESDGITFAEAAEGGAKDYVFAFTGLQDAGTGTLWTKIFENSGTTAAITYMPYGNDVPTATQPHFTASATIAAPDGDFLGGDADASPTSRYTFEAEWKCAAKPTKVTTAG